jgi:hypothetical protein
MKHYTKLLITLLTKVFNTLLLRQYFPPALKHARMKSILKPGKVPTLPPSHRSANLLDSVGKLC